MTQTLELFENDYDLPQLDDGYFLDEVEAQHQYRYGTSFPGASSTTTPGTITGEPGAALYVLVSTFRGSSLDPSVVTLTGAGQEWTEVTLPTGFWSTSGTTRRRAQLFRAEGVTGSGQLTISYANQPSYLEVIVAKVYASAGNPLQVVDAAHSQITGNTQQPVTLVAQEPTSILLMFIVTNAATNEDGMTVPGVNWSKLRSSSFGSSPTSTHFYAWRKADGLNDLTPDWVTTTGATSSAYTLAVEVPYGVYIPDTNVPLYAKTGVLRVHNGILRVMTVSGPVQIYP